MIPPRNETTLDDVNDIAKSFENNSVRYMIVGGYAIDGKKGKITRYHDDVDMLVLENEYHKIMEAVQKLGYKLIKKYNSTCLFKKNKEGEMKPSKIHLSFLKRRGKFAVSEGRIATTRFPINWFDKSQTVEIKGVRFNIVTDELLKAFGLDAPKGDDAQYAKKIKVDERLYKQITRTLKK